MTKYLNGHSDVVGGARASRATTRSAERLHFLQKAVGAVPSPFDCYMVLRGLKTLARAHRAARAEATKTRGAPRRATRRSSASSTPGLDDAPGPRARAQADEGPRRHDQLRARRRPRRAPRPSSKALARLRVRREPRRRRVARRAPGHHDPREPDPPRRARALGIGDGLIRLSVGLEDVDDLAEDLERGFQAAAKRTPRLPGKRGFAFDDVECMGRLPSHGRSHVPSSPLLREPQRQRSSLGVIGVLVRRLLAIPRRRRRASPSRARSRPNAPASRDCGKTGTWFTIGSFGNPELGHMNPDEPGQPAHRSGRARRRRRPRISRAPSRSRARSPAGGRRLRRRRPTAQLTGATGGSVTDRSGTSSPGRRQPEHHRRTSTKQRRDLHRAAALHRGASTRRSASGRRRPRLGDASTARTPRTPSPQQTLLERTRSSASRTALSRASERVERRQRFSRSSWRGAPRPRGASRAPASP